MPLGVPGRRSSDGKPTDAGVSLPSVLALALPKTSDRGDPGTGVPAAEVGAVEYRAETSDALELAYWRLPL